MMLVDMKPRSSNPSSPTASLLLVGEPSPGMDRKHALLREAGFDVTRADTICHAEVFSESQHFEIAVYDEGLLPEEQISLARVMRVRWPWMRLVRCGHMPLEGEQNLLFDGTAVSESQLPECIERTLGR
jgi:hypothetical protein